MPRGDQMSRQWRIIRILEAMRRGATVPEIADQLGTNVRTVYRDMDALEQAGFPLYTEKEEGVERWMFIDNFRSKIPIPLAFSEIVALSIAEDHLKAFDGTVFSEALKTAFDKVRSMLGPESRTFLQGLSKSFRVGLAGKKNYAKHRDTIDLINRAVLERYTLVITYRSSKGEELERKIDPYHVWFMAGTIYVVAHCHKRKELRTFVLDRITSAKLTDDRFEVPSDFNMEEFTKDRFRVMDGDPVEVKIRFTKNLVQYLKEREWHPTQKIEEDGDGSAILTMQVEGLPEVMSWVLSFGSHAEVLAPDSLRNDVAADLKSAVKHY